MTIKTETDHSGTDLNDVVGILHKQLERGYIGPSQAVALAGLVTDRRAEAIARFVELAEEIDANARLRDAEGHLIYPARDRRPMHECAEAIRRVVSEAS